MRAKLNGEWFEVESLEITGRFVAVQKPKPPSKPKAPAEPPASGGGDLTELGSLTKNKPRLQKQMLSGHVYSYAFSIPQGGAPGVTFEWTPQGDESANYIMWVSEAPGGKSMRSKYALVKGPMSGGGQFQISVGVKGTPGEGRGQTIHAGRTYYVNMRCDRPRFMLWRVTGNFPK